MCPRAGKWVVCLSLNWARRAGKSRIAWVEGRPVYPRSRTWSFVVTIGRRGTSSDAFRAVACAADNAGCFSIEPLRSFSSIKSRRFVDAKVPAASGGRDSSFGHCL